MVFFLIIAAVVWGLGHYLGAPRAARWNMLGLLYVAVLIALVVLPESNPMRATLGGSLAEWLSVGGIALAIWGYTLILRRLRKSVRPENKATDNLRAEYSETEIARNARHIVLREIGGPGQKRLKEAKVLAVGAGGLGSPVLQYLAGAGVGTIGVIDDDVVSNSNLQRQIIHTDERIGMPKVFSAQLAMEAQNPFVTVRPYNRKLTAEIARDLMSEFDLVIDGTDDPETRYLVNAAAYEARRPLVSGALSQWEGQITTFAPWEGTPCYRCLFPEPAAAGLAPSCAEGGVLSALPGIVGTIMAAEAIKEVTGAGEGLRGRLMIYDALYTETRMIAVKKRSDCPVCAD